ncbi:hypothetical protein K7X08_015371 [Anisodus acutangulus]|uniref:Uncharacterized protein n=1 Tax=Anisodus acutangulus TaxID=402998 RepID=A0A9Q1L5R1_9SOLA|nr:hypothetical protein K7X08_015371 [Anisodus acutangulus]
MVRGSRRGQTVSLVTDLATGTGCEIWSNVSILSSQNQSDVFILDAERDLVPTRNRSATNVPNAFTSSSSFVASTISQFNGGTVLKELVCIVSKSSS